MFDKAVKVSEVGRSILKIALVAALLLQSPLYATDPIDFDPDPNAPITIVVEADEEEATTANLPPGHYRIIVVAEDGSTEIRELHQQ